MANNIIIRKMALPSHDWHSVAKGAGLAILGAGVTYLSQHLTDLDFGQYNYIVIPLVTVALNVARKVLLNQPDAEPDAQPDAEPEVQPEEPANPHGPGSLPPGPSHWPM